MPYKGRVVRVELEGGGGAAAVETNGLFVVDKGDE
jgi:hypothetical protein